MTGPVTLKGAMLTEFTPERKPANEAARLRSVHRSGLMDSDHSDRFDLYTDLMRGISGYPVAYCGLIDEARQYFLSHNFPECLNLAEVPRSQTLCQFALLSPKPYIVPDLRLHPKLRVHPLVTGEPRFVAWAAFPLTNAEGHILGTLCAAAYEPHDLTETQIDLMRRVAAELTLAIETQVELKEAAARRCARVLGQLSAQPGLETTDAATRFLRLCEGIPGGPEDLRHLAPSGLVEAGAAGEAVLSPLGRNLQSRLGLAPPGFAARPRLLDSDALMSDLLNLVGA